MNFAKEKKKMSQITKEANNIKSRNKHLQEDLVRVKKDMQAQMQEIDGLYK